MTDWFDDLLTLSNDYMPHGFCFLWQTSILWLHVLSDAIIALSYFSIPVALIYFIKNRKDLVFKKLFVLFGGFILLCGINHLMDIWTIWQPDYWFEGILKLASATVSLVTAITIWRIMPLLLELPSPTAFKTKGIFLSAIFNASPDAMIISDDKGKIAMINHQAEKLLGFEAGELVGKPLELLASSDPNKNILSLSLTNPLLSLDKYLPVSEDLLFCVIKKKDQTELDVEVCFSPIDTAQGKYFAASMRDVTQHKQAEVILKESEERFRQLANDAATMIWVTDENRDFSFVNQCWRDFTGVDVEKLTYLEWLELIHPDDKEIAFIGNTGNIHMNQVMTSEYRMRGANGNWYWILDKGKLSYRNDVFCGYIGSAIDITARKEAEVDLRVAAAAFESQEPMIITDANFIILKANNAFVEISGYDRDEIIGQTLDSLIMELQGKIAYPAILDNFKTSEFWQGDILCRRKNGDSISIWLTITAVKNDEGLVTHYVGNYIDISKHKLAEEEIKKLAFYDPLTQLPNRRLLQERINHAIQRAQRDGQQFAILNLDLDRFKDVNDTLGHKAGDELLQQVAARIRCKLRAVDMVARQGGDEFVVLLENIANPKDASRVAKRIVDDISSAFQLVQNHEVWINVSIGISLFPQHGVNFDVLMAQADSAMYKAKEQGGGSIVYFSEDLTRLSRERMNLEGRLRKAIHQNELRVFFQPQIEIATDRIIGAEALVRWQDPNEGLIPPGRFIPVAEETKLIVAIGEWVLHETCKQGRIWLDMGLPAINLAVNVSTQQFKISDIIELVNVVIDQTGFPATQLELEITESGLMKNQENSVEILNKLHELGIRIAIDDFGTGYSSLAYLKRFPLDVLKIDKSFIDDIPHSKDDMEIAATIIAMANNLGFKVIAEGVETKAQLDFLRQKGCDSYQGYYKCRPIPVEDFVKLLQEQQQNTT